MRKLSKTRRYIIGICELIFFIAWLNGAIMFITVFVYYGGSPTSNQEGPINNKGEYVLESHGRKTVVTQSQFEFITNYFVVGMFSLIFGALVGIIAPILDPDYHTRPGRINDMLQSNINFKSIIKYLKK